MSEVLKNFKLKLNYFLQKADRWWFLAGLSAVCFMVLPYLVLGTDSIVAYHDQLDGELIAYALQAKYLFSGNVLQEFMNGVSKTALTPPAPMSVLLFCSGNYFAAFVLLQMIGSITGYVGMYLLSKQVSSRRLVAAMAGVLFAYLPLLPVYGLSQYGIPLLLWCFLQMKEGRYRKTGLLYAVLYALNSSLVLVGFAVLAMILIGIIYQWGKGLRVKSAAGVGIRAMGVAWLGMLLSYLLGNASLLSQLLGISGGITSHKTEYLLQAENFWDILAEGFLKGRQHSMDYHVYILAATVLVLILFWVPGVFSNGGKAIHGGQAIHGGKPIQRREGAETGGDQAYKRMIFLIACNLMLALVAALWNGPAGIWLRTRLDILGSFQLNRVLWIAPTFWYLLFAAVWAAVLEPRNSVGKRWEKIRSITAVSAVLLATVLTGFTVLKASNLKPNLQKLLNPEYPAISYGDYYALGVMEQVENYIREQTGLAQEDYRVVSLGIDPAAALYGGFYCLDGYSNNYPLEYKHNFRRIIAPELEKSEYLKNYYDGWGNRCYIFSAEIPGYYRVEKGSFSYQNIELNTEALKEMGGKYVLSAAYVENGSESGLALVREEAFETPESYYRIYLYEIR